MYGAICPVFFFSFVYIYYWLEHNRRNTFLKGVDLMGEIFIPDTSSAEVYCG